MKIQNLAFLIKNEKSKESFFFIGKASLYSFCFKFFLENALQNKNTCYNRIIKTGANVCVNYSTQKSFILQKTSNISDVVALFVKQMVSEKKF